MADGGGSSDPWWFIGILVVLGALWIAGGGAERARLNPPAPVIPSPIRPNVSSSQSDGRYTYPSAYNYYSGSSRAAPVSPLGYGRVKLTRGTAASATKPGDEYLILSASSANDGPVAISGWTLTNGRGQKLALQGSKFVEQNSFQARIPDGVLVLGSSEQVAGPIILNPGERAVVITGQSPSFGPHPIKSSFKVNKCLGYLNEEARYELVPPVLNNCPLPTEEVAAASLPDKCYDFVRRLGSCHVPKVETTPEGDWSVDGRTDIPRACFEFVKPYLNYTSCVERHAGDPDFLGQEWRIYLRQKAEMWARERETITLRDQSGLVVDELTY